MLAHPWFDEIRDKPDVFGNIAEVARKDPDHSMTDLHHKCMSMKTGKAYTQEHSEASLEAMVNKIIEEYKNSPGCTEQGSLVEPHTSLRITKETPEKQSRSPSDDHGIAADSRILPAQELRKLLLLLRLLSEVLAEGMLAKCQNETKEEQTKESVHCFKTKLQRRQYIKAIPQILQSANEKHIDFTETMKGMGFKVCHIPAPLVATLQADLNHTKRIDWEAIAEDMEAHIKLRLPVYPDLVVDAHAVRQAAPVHVPPEKKSSCCIIA